MAMMRAAVYRGPDDVRVEALPVPDVGPGEALVRIAACGVCGTDLKKIHYGIAEPPLVFGHEMAGTIVDLGPGVSGWRVGDRVAVHHHVPCMDCYYCMHRDYSQCAAYKCTGTTAGFQPAGGGFAETIRVMDWVVRRGMVRIPEEVTFEEATFVEPVNTCLKAVYRTRVGPDETVLVMGQGQIGLLFTQLSRLRGARVVATDRLEYRLEHARRYGAIALNPGQSDIAAEIRAVTEGRGADVAIIAVPDGKVAAGAFDAVRPGGAVLLFAHTRVGDPITVDGGAVCMQEKALIGSYSADITLQDEVADLIFSRRLDVRSLITHRYPLEDIREAVNVASSPRDGSLKVMVNP